jgi:hypothetical protein
MRAPRCKLPATDTQAGCGDSEQKKHRYFRSGLCAFTERTRTSLGKAIQDRLQFQDQPGSARDTQERRDGWLAPKKRQHLASKRCQRPAKARIVTLPGLNHEVTRSGGLELMGSDVMEDKIIAPAQRFVCWIFQAELNDLRLRIQGPDDIP